MHIMKLTVTVASKLARHASPLRKILDPPLYKEARKTLARFLLL